MAQNREKEEPLELKVQSLPDNCKISNKTPICPGSSGPDPTRIDPCSTEKAQQRIRPRSEKRALDRENRAVEDVSGQVSEGVAKKAVNRCSGCGKRVGLTGFRCRCGDLFCPEHRYSDRHECSFDYKAAGREAIARENPVVRAAKLLKV